MVEDLVSKFLATSRPVRRVYERDDLFQECLIHWYHVRDRHAEERGASLKTFMTRVVENKLRELLRSEKAELRRLNHKAVPFSTPVGGEEEGRTVEDVVDETVGDWDQERVLEEVDLPGRLAEAREGLTEREKAILDLLAEGVPKTQVARRLGVHRDTVYDDIKRIRKLFTDQGLKEFLE